MKFSRRVRCISCHAYLTEQERAYSHGVCPFCGYKKNPSSILVETYEEIGMWKYVDSVKEFPVPWWKFWVKDKTELRTTTKLTWIVKK